MKASWLAVILAAAPAAAANVEIKAPAAIVPSANPALSMQNPASILQETPALPTLTLPDAAVPSTAPEVTPAAPQAPGTLPALQKAMEPANAAAPAEQVGAMWSQALKEGAPAAAVDAAGDSRWTALLDAARTTTGPAVEKVLAAKKKGTSVHAVLAGKDTKTITEYNGVPSRVTELKTEGQVFRHWVLNEKDLPEILKAKALKAGHTSYVEFTGSSRAYIKDIYIDLRGVFFTGPENDAGNPRVLNQSTPHYVDFKIPAGVRALSLDGRDVMMVPAEPGAAIPIEIVSSSADAR